MLRILKRIVSPLTYFIKDSRTVGIILLGCTVLSISLANSHFGIGYRHLWNGEIHSTASLHLPRTILDWINNFLMGIFFLMAGTEIKRELMEGELSSFKK